MAEKLTRQEQKRLTKERLLEAGADLLRDKPVGEVFAQIRAQDIVRAAGVSTGAFYHHWESQSDYVVELFEYMTSVDRFTPATDALVVAVASAVEGGASFEEMVAVGADTTFWSIAENPYFTVLMGLWAWSTKGDEWVEGLLRRCYRLSDDRFVVLYLQALDAYGRKLRPGTTPEQLAVILAALIEGFVIRHAFDSTAVVLGDGKRPPTLVGRAAAALAMSMTEPVDGAAETG